MGNRKVSSMIEEVDSGAQHMEKKRRSRKHKRSYREI